MSDAVDDHLLEIGTRIKRARWALALTQEEAAAKGKMSYQYFRQAERGQCNLTVDMLHRIAAVLNAPVGWLVDSDPKESLKFEKTLLAKKASAPRRGRKPKAERKP